MASAGWYLERLSRFPHRGTGTQAEAEAAGQIAAWLQGMGYAVERQPFPAPRDSLYLGPGLVLAGAVAAGAMGAQWPWAGLLLLTGLLVPLVGEMLGTRCNLDLLLPKVPSQNVIARWPEPAVAQPECPESAMRRTVVISAHYDTQRGSYLFHPAFAPLLQGYFYLVYTGIVAVLLGLLFAWIWPESAWPALLRRGGMVLSAVNAVIVGLCLVTGRFTNGANDNGSGVALALSLAERLGGQAPAGIDLVFLFTGAEEVGTRGMKRYVQTCGLDPAGTYFINLDNLGAGQLHYLTGEGMLRLVPYSDDLIEIADALADEHPGAVFERSNLLLPTDGLVPALAGYRAITFIAFGPDGQPVNYHWHTDEVRNVDAEFLRFVEQFVLAYVLQLLGALNGTNHSKEAW